MAEPTGGGEPAYLRATRDGYDAIAVGYAERFRAELDARPLDRAVLGAFAELVRSDGGGPVADVGCGPGWVTAHLHALGLTVRGIDLSPAMVALARAEHPGVRFDEGTMTALDLDDGTLGGLVAWYSLIHVPRDRHAQVLGEFHRVLAPGGHLLLAFQVGDDTVRRTEALGHTVAIDFHRCSPDRVTDLLRRAGFRVDARLVREPDEAEKVPQAYLLGRKAPDT